MLCFIDEMLNWMQKKIPNMSKAKKLVSFLKFNSFLEKKLSPVFLKIYKIIIPKSAKTFNRKMRQKIPCDA